ncbi:MAG: TRAP transporter small permease [Syntrophales bacterium]
MMYRLLEKIISFFEESVIVVCMTGIFVLTFGAVMSRFVFNFSIAWSEELVRYMFIWGALFGASYAFKYQSHSGLPILVEKFPPRLARIVRDFGFILTVGLFAVIVYTGWGLVKLGLQSGQLSPATKIPYWVVNFGLVLAFVFCIYRVVQARFKPYKTIND